MDAKEEKLKRFANDKVMNEAVFELILTTFLKPKGNKDVHFLASERLAVDNLSIAWTELDKYKSDSESESKTAGNIGV